MSVIAQLQIGENIYDVLSFRYRFEASTDKKGRPTSRFRGGEMIVVLEVGSDTTIQELFLSEEPRAIRGSLNVWNEEDMTPIRTIEWEKGYIYSIRETMQRDTSSPMTITVSITPLRLDINRTTRLDRRVPQTYGFWWEEYKPEEATPQIVSKNEDEPIIPECTVQFRRTNDYDGSFGFDWLRTGDTGETGCGWYKDTLSSLEQYDMFVREYTSFTQQWKMKYEEHRATAQYVVPWVTLMNGQTARFRIKLDVNQPSGELDILVTGAGKNVLSIEEGLTSISAGRTGNYYNGKDLIVKCNGTFSSQTAIEVYAKKELVGKMIFIPNDKTYPLDIAIVTVKTKSKEGKILYKSPSDSVLDGVTRLLQQAYIIPSFKYYNLDLSEPVEAEIIQVKKVPGRSPLVPVRIINFSKYGGSGKPMEINMDSTDSLLDFIWKNNDSKIISINSRVGKDRFGSLHNFLNQMLYRQYRSHEEELKNRLKLYFINEAVHASTGDAKGVASAKDMAACLSKYGYTEITAVHELLHCLSLKHPFLDIGESPVSKKYLFRQLSTENIMDYDHSGDNIEDRKSLWYWQIKQIWNYLK